MLLGFAQIWFNCLLAPLAFRFAFAPLTFGLGVFWFGVFRLGLFAPFLVHLVERPAGIQQCHQVATGVGGAWGTGHGAWAVPDSGAGRGAAPRALNSP